MTDLVTTIKGIKVSTVVLPFLPWAPAIDPYETMIFGLTEQEEEKLKVEYPIRYKTEDEARKGHKEAIRLVKEIIK